MTRQGPAGSKQREARRDGKTAKTENIYRNESSGARTADQADGRTRLRDERMPA
jgi:hypothetical protein